MVWVFEAMKNVGRPKLSWEQANLLRRLYAEGSKQMILARRFKISQTAVSFIINNKTYQSVNTTKKAHAA